VKKNQSSVLSQQTEKSSTENGFQAVLKLVQTTATVNRLVHDTKH